MRGSQSSISSCCLHPLLQDLFPPTDEEPETPRLGGTPRMQTQTSGPLRSPRVSGSPTALGSLVKKLSGGPLGPQVGEGLPDCFAEILLENPDVRSSCHLTYSTWAFRLTQVAGAA